MSFLTKKSAQPQASAVADGAAPLKAGKLAKRGALRSTWKVRYYELHRGKLACFDSATAPKPSKVLALARCQVRRRRDVGCAYAFELLWTAAGSRASLLLRGASDDDADAWIASLRRAAHADSAQDDFAVGQNSPSAADDASSSPRARAVTTAVAPAADASGSRGGDSSSARGAESALSVMFSRSSYHEASASTHGSHSPPRAPAAARRLSQNQSVLTSRQDFAKLQNALLQMSSDDDASSRTTSAPSSTTTSSSGTAPAVRAATATQPNGSAATASTAASTAASASAADASAHALSASEARDTLLVDAAKDARSRIEAAQTQIELMKMAAQNDASAPLAPSPADRASRLTRLPNAFAGVPELTPAMVQAHQRKEHEAAAAAAKAQRTNGSDDAAHKLPSHAIMSAPAGAQKASEMGESGSDMDGVKLRASNDDAIVSGEAHRTPQPLPNMTKLEWLRQAKRELVSEADPRLQYEVDYNRPLGKGGFGEVYVATHKTRGETVAIKQMQISKKNRMEYLLIETDLHARVSQHKNVVRFIDAFLLRDEKQFWVVMEFINGATLFDLKQYDSFGEKHASWVTRQLVDALVYIHHTNRIHRDIKSQNVLLGPAGEVKLTDFGLAAQLTEENSSRRTMLGTVDFMAPEILRGANYHCKVDVWSIGMLIHEMLRGVTPFNNYREPRAVLLAIDTGGIPQLKKKLISALGRDFVNKCLAINPNDRPSASELLEHAWFAKMCPADGACIVSVLRQFRNGEAPSSGSGASAPEATGAGCSVQ